MALAFECEHAQAGDAAEVALVPRGDAESVRERRCRDPEVVAADHVSPSGEGRPDLRVNACDGLGDRHGLELREEMLDESAPSRPPSASRAVDALQQLADRDDADRALLVADDSLDRRTLALVDDEQVGVDQDGQGLSGGPTSARIARTSSAKSRSTGGAAPSNSLNRAAPISRSRGGEITATGAPARVISISSPAATRFNTSEKRRAASVALRRATGRTYQINQIKWLPTRPRPPGCVSPI